MKAIQVIKPGDARLTEADKPVLTGAKDVLVKVAAAGICGSDIHITHGTNPYATYPRIIGHEMAGTVEAVGSEVTEVKPGDRVVVEPISYCGECYPCKKGRPNVCRHLQVRGVHVDGGFAEYTMADEKTVHKIPDQLNFVQAAMVEPYTIGAQAAWRGGVQAGDVTLVHGAGPIGLIVMDTVRSMGATCIISEVSENRLALAKKLGADHVVNPLKEDLSSRISEITDGMGPNVIFEAAGIPSLMPLSLDMVSSAGTIVAMAFGKEPVPLDFSIINKKEVTIVGTRLQSLKFKQVIAEFPGRLDTVNELVSHVLPVEEFQKGFDLFTDKDSGACKIVLTF